MTTVPSSVVIEVGKVYLIGLAFPSALTDPSPIPFIPLVEGWHTMDAVQRVHTARDGSTSARNVRSIRRHMGVVMRYDPSSQRAVILLGTSSPHGGNHRFIPWHGTPRLSFQTREVLDPYPRDAFVGYPGYLNFTHTICVTVMQQHDFMALVVPAFAFVRDLPRGREIRVPHVEMERLRRLHSSYWTGSRYLEDGSSDHVSDGSDDDDGVDRGRSHANPLAPLVSSVRADGTVVLEVHDPIDPITGERFSEIVARALRYEDRRATQVELMDDLVDLVHVPPPSIYCYMEPLTLASLQEVW